MKKKKKVLAAALVSAMLIGSVGASSVYAASSDSGTINNVTCSASVVYTKNSAGTNNGATATTRYGAPASIKAKATVYYNDRYGNLTSKSSGYAVNTIGGVSATASADGLGTVCGGKGEHYVGYGSYTWTPTTTIGKTK